MNSCSHNRNGISVRELLNPCTTETDQANYSLESMDDRHHSPTTRCSRGPWKLEEDRLLAELVKRYGPCHWSAIAAHFPNRTGKQARERWTNQLNPKLKKKNWSAEEDYTILFLRTQLGNKWSAIAGMLPGRTDNSVKNRFNSTLQRAIRDIGTKSGVQTVTIDDVLNSLHSRSSYRLLDFATAETLKSNCLYSPRSTSQNRTSYHVEELQTTKRNRMDYVNGSLSALNVNNYHLTAPEFVTGRKRKTSGDQQTLLDNNEPVSYGNEKKSQKAGRLDLYHSTDHQMASGNSSHGNQFMNVEAHRFPWG